MAVSKSAAMVAERLIRLVYGLAFVVLAARYLSPEAFGVIAFSQAVIMVLNGLAGLGLDEVLPRALMRQRAWQSAFASALWPRLAAGGIALLALLAALALLRPAETPALLIMAPMLLLGSFTLHERVLLARHRQDLIALSRLALGLGFFACKALAIVLTQDIAILAAILTAESAASLAVLRWLSREHVADGPPPSRRSVRAMLGRSLPLVTASSLLLLFTYTDQALIRILLSPEAVGAYALGVRPSEAWIMLVSTFAMSATPGIIEDCWRAGGRAPDAPRLRMAMEVGVGSSTLFAILMLVFAPAVLAAMVGDKLTAAGPVAQVYALLTPLAAMRLVSGKWFVAKRMNATLAQRAAVGLAINVVLGLALIPLLGPVGAAWATLLSYLFVGLLADFLHPASRDMVAVKLAAFLPLESLRRRR